MLIIEGSDLVGKTTLCKSLVSILNRVFERPHIYRHLSRLPNSFNRYYSYAQAAMTYSVQDRFHMSEPVYANMRGDLTPLDPWKYKMVDAMLKLKGAFTVVVYCADNDLLRERYRADEMYTLESVIAVNAMFTEIAVHREWKQYSPNIDHTIEIRKNRPFLTPLEEHDLADKYMRHLRLYEELYNEGRKLWMQERL